MGQVWSLCGGGGGGGRVGGMEEDSMKSSIQIVPLCKVHFK